MRARGSRQGLAGACFPAAILTASFFKRPVEFKRMFETEARRSCDFLHRTFCRT